MRGMLNARKRGIFKRGYDVVADGKPLTALISGRREACEFALAGVRYRIERDGRKRFVLTGPDGRAATAAQETRRSWSITAATGDAQLVRPSRWWPTWEVHQRGSQRGIIRRLAFTRSYVADLAPDLPLPVQVFAFYVVLMIFERAARAAAAAGSAGAGG